LASEMDDVNQSSSRAASQIAFAEGIVSSVPVLIVSSALVLLANARSPAFRHGLGPSGKTALAITPPLFWFARKGEEAMIRLRKEAIARASSSSPP